jgi:4-amino-4-deoxy-L-arabinose transferase-like glycosyltransferase
MRWGIAAVVFVLLTAAHYPYLRLPYFWDELGQFIPASLDLFYTADWIPVTTTPNIHPPGIMAYLAVSWRVFGGVHSILTTRLAMLFLASFGVLGSFLLAIRLGRGTPGYPALAAAAMLLTSPLFYSQSMLAQLDMPAMVFSIWALLLFFEERYARSALACAALVLCKETGAILPGMFAAWLLFREKKWRPALYFMASILPLFLWIFALWRTTGNPLGDSQFAQYNAVYSLHPVRLLSALPRRLYYLFIAEFRWIGTLAIFLARPLFRTREWAWAAAFLFAHVLVVSVFGGAVLERYLLPVLPIVYAAMGCAFSSLERPAWRIGAPAVVCIGLIVSVIIGPPYLSPFENNIAFTDFVQLHEEAALFLNRMPDRPRSVATAWPLTDALRRPEFGFTKQRFEQVVETTDFSAANVEAALAKSRTDAVVIYDRLNEPAWSLSSIPAVQNFLTTYYGFAPQITTEQMLRLGYVQLIRIEQRGQWVTVYAPRM